MVACCGDRDDPVPWLPARAHSLMVGPDPAQTWAACDPGLHQHLEVSAHLCSAAAPGAGQGRGPVIYRGDMFYLSQTKARFVLRSADFLGGVSPDK